ncbi:MAG: tyrosine-type recombinase/integrase [Acidimicrobiales bacterium]
MDIDIYLKEFKADWRLLGRSVVTVDNYCTFVREFVGGRDLSSLSLADAKEWLAASASAESARYRGRAVRAFGRWAASNDGPAWPWTSSVPLAATPPTPQPTVTEAEYERARSAARSLRDRLVIELLWCTGMRVSELARVEVDHVDIDGGMIVVPRSKTGRPRVVPMSERATRLCRRHVLDRRTGSLLSMSPHAIQLLLRRISAPSAHAWRRGWAVNALRGGVSEASVRAAAGWSSGAMVVRYTSAVSGALAIDEFRRAFPQGLA